MYHGWLPTRYNQNDDISMHEEAPGFTITTKMACSESVMRFEGFCEKTQ
jgi:hypothetical protein